MASHSHIPTSSSAVKRTSSSAPKTKQTIDGKAQVISQLESSSFDMPSSSSQSSKRKRNTVNYEAGEDNHEYDHGAPPKKKGKKKDEEKRLRVHRKKPPKSFIDRLERVRAQRMFLIDRKRSLSSDGTHEEEVFDIAGTTGNIYQIKISKVPTCTCPDAVKGNQCKHIIYVLVNVLKAPEELSYQLALLSKELAEIFSNAPATPQSSSQEEASSTDTGGKRKPIEGDCPVCVMEFQEKDDIVWCKAACGNNIHRQCFEQWARTKPGQVKCVYCRTVWKGDEKSVQRIAKSQLSEGKVNREGYVNVASQLGISGRRDTSTYHQPWVHQRSGGYRGYRSWRDYNDDSYDDYAPGEGF